MKYATAKVPDGFSYITYQGVNIPQTCFTITVSDHTSTQALFYLDVAAHIEYDVGTSLPDYYRFDVTAPVDKQMLVPIFKLLTLQYTIRGGTVFYLNNLVVGTPFSITVTIDATISASGQQTLTINHNQGGIIGGIVEYF